MKNKWKLNSNIGKIGYRMETNNAERVEELLTSFVEIDDRMKADAKRKKDISEELFGMCPEGDWKSATIKGTSLQARVARRENVKYDNKDLLEEAALDSFEKELDLFRVEYKEKKVAVETYIEQNPDCPISEKLKANRVSSIGSPSLSVDRLK